MKLLRPKEMTKTNNNKTTDSFNWLTNEEIIIIRSYRLCVDLVYLNLSKIYLLWMIFPFVWLSKNDKAFMRSPWDWWNGRDCNTSAQQYTKHENVILSDVIFRVKNAHNMKGLNRFSVIITSRATETTAKHIYI